MADGKKSSLRGQLTTQQKSLFNSRSKLYSGSLRVNAPYREMTIGNSFTSKNGTSTKWFSDRRQMEMPLGYKGVNTIKRLETRKTRDSYEAFLGDKNSVVEINARELPQHLIMVAHQYPIALEHWKYAIANRALVVFQESFTLKKFNSANGRKWKQNTPWTIKKRTYKGTWPGAGGLMQETDKLRYSLHIEKNEYGLSVTSSKWYAAIHNDPRPGETYGNGFGGRYSTPKPVTRRQFMGHSTLMDSFIAQYEINYLFHSIFRRLA